MLGQINEFIWGSVLLTLMLIVGLLLTFKTRFLQFTHIGRMFKETVGQLFCKSNHKNGVSPFEAMSTALSGTMGTGNIVGVGAALVLGGAGALFWMVISAFLCMILKFSEVALSVQFREKDCSGQWQGGPMYYIKNGLPKLYPLATVFCVATLLASFGIGNAAQVGAMTASLQDTFSISPIIIGIATALTTALVIFGGVKRITGFTAKLVPFMTAFYFIGAVYVLIRNRSMLIPALYEVLTDAFDFSSVSAGVLGFGVSRSLRYGVSRGVFTNEAGMGSAPIVHATANNTPTAQGYWGMFEVFLDTVVMCTLTGLVILTSGVLNSCPKSGLNLTADAFSTVFGKLGGVFVCISVVLFAFGAIIGWSYYGLSCCRFLFKSSLSGTLYKIMFCIAIVISSVFSADIIFELSDTLNAFMALPNLIALIFLSPELIHIIKR
ncbi:MAG: sodium:alanine symporter family protein [Clostridia bacterium]|nr:sodium:alanine symporter family protein [Clostridia bacterium]